MKTGFKKIFAGVSAAVLCALSMGSTLSAGAAEITELKRGIPVSAMVSVTQSIDSSRMMTLPVTVSGRIVGRTTVRRYIDPLTGKEYIIFIDTTYEEPDPCLTPNGVISKDVLPKVVLPKGVLK